MIGVEDENDIEYACAKCVSGTLPFLDVEFSRRTNSPSDVKWFDKGDIMDRMFYKKCAEP